MAPAPTLPGQTIRQAAKDRASLSRDVVKPVLASPYSVAWPSLPNHLQNGVMAALPQILPPELADYHISRARCSQAAKRARRKMKRKAEGERDRDGMDIDGEEGRAKDKEGAEATAVGPAPADAGTDAGAIPPRPEILDHLVLGLNETIRELERSIDDLRIRMALLAEGADPTLPRLLPTAPEPASSPAPVQAALTYLLVPHTSVSPLSLIDPLPTYCATYNTLLRQASDMVRGVRLPGGASADPGGAFGAREIQIVPLGKREADIAVAAGLRRVTSVGVRASHPAVGVLERLVPKSVLKPPRHSMTLPWPTMRLKIHGAGGEGAPAGEEGKEAGTTAATVTTSKDTDGAKATAKTAATASTAEPAIAYAPLHIKALHTTAPLDPTARKAKRLAEVRQKRVEAKATRLARRKEMERKVRADLLGAGKSTGKGKGFGRAERRAAKAAKAAKAEGGAQA